MKYDVIIIGAGPGGIFSAYELMKRRPGWKIGVFEGGTELEKRHCPIDGDKIKSCIRCKSCSIMSGFGGAGAFSDGKYNITNDFGGTLYAHIGRKKALELMRLDASVRHLGTDINYIVLGNLYAEMKDHIDFHFNTLVDSIELLQKEEAEGEPAESSSAAFAESAEPAESSSDTSRCHASHCDTPRYRIHFEGGRADARYCIVSAGRSGSKWMEKVCRDLEIPTKSNRVDIGVRVELPAVVFSHLTDELYESKIVYRTEKFEDSVRTFCMNPNGIVVNENTNGIVTVNGHSFEDPSKKTENTNFALLVSKHFSEPFKDSNGYGESIARLSNMLGGGVIVQRFGDLARGRRSNPARISECTVQPTLQATPGDLSLVLPKRILDGIIEMIYALDKIAPGTANNDTLLYGVEVKFYNMEVSLDENLETNHPGLYVIGDGSGVTHSLSHASASGVYVAEIISEQE